MIERERNIISAILHQLDNGEASDLLDDTVGHHHGDSGSYADAIRDLFRCREQLRDLLRVDGEVSKAVKS